MYCKHLKRTTVVDVDTSVGVFPSNSSLSIAKFHQWTCLYIARHSCKKAFKLETHLAENACFSYDHPVQFLVKPRNSYHLHAIFVL